MNTDTIYQTVTDRIVAKLEAGTIPWKNPRKGRCIGPQFAQNLVSRRAYHGVNFWMLNYGTEFKSPYWVSFKQALDLGGNVRRGEHGIPVVFWKFFQVEDKQTGKTKNIPLLRAYTVFNLEQTENVRSPEPVALLDFNPIESAKAIVDAMPNPPRIEFSEPQIGAGCYHPDRDTVVMADPRDYRSPEEYYSVLFHELGHSTGHVKRLNRDMSGKFMSAPYSKEELIAELTSGYLCAKAQIFDSTVENTAAYIADWIRILKNDRTMFVHAAGKAQHAADWIRNTQNIEVASDLPLAA